MYQISGCFFKVSLIGCDIFGESELVLVEKTYTPVN